MDGLANESFSVYFIVCILKGLWLIGLANFDLNLKMNPLFKQSNRQMDLCLGYLPVLLIPHVDNKNPRI